LIVVAGSAGTGWRVRASPHGESTRRPGAPASRQPSQASGQNSQGRDERHWSRCISTEPRIADRLLKHSSPPRSDQDERLLPPGPESSQRNPEQLVHGIQSTARPLCVQGQQLLTESQVFEDEVLPGTETADHPPKEMPERHDHRTNLTYESESSVAPSHSFCRCTTFWRGTTCSATIVETLLRLFSLTAETSAKPKPGFQPQSRSCRVSWDGLTP
jgi:hypothetical protein